MGRCYVNKQRVLFLCTHNSARSQMAEGFLRKMAGDRFEVQSAGTEKRSVHPLAIRAMADRGIDISGHTSKVYDGLMQEPWDYLITVCDDANEQCPFIPGTRKRLHWSFTDPSRAAGSEDERLAVFRSVRDEIEARLGEWLKGA
jgi:arsenate reductase